MFSRTCFELSCNTVGNINYDSPASILVGMDMIIVSYVQQILSIFHINESRLLIGSAADPVTNLVVKTIASQAWLRVKIESTIADRVL